MGGGQVRDIDVVLSRISHDSNPKSMKCKGSSEKSISSRNHGSSCQTDCFISSSVLLHMQFVFHIACKRPGPDIILQCLSHSSFILKISHKSNPLITLMLFTVFPSSTYSLQCLEHND